MPALMSSKFMWSQRLLMRFRSIHNNPILTDYEKRVMEEKIWRDAEELGFSVRSLSRYFNRVFEDKEAMEIKKKILIRIQNFKYTKYEKRKVKKESSRAEERG